jgi:hypothetical protein
MPKLTLEEFGVLAAQTGLPLSDAQKATLHAIYPVLQELIARAAAAQPREAEPSVIFVPEQGA